MAFLEIRPAKCQDDELHIRIEALRNDLIAQREALFKSSDELVIRSQERFKVVQQVIDDR